MPKTYFGEAPVGYANATARRAVAYLVIHHTPLSTLHTPATFGILNKEGREKYERRVVGGYLHNLDNIWTYNLRLLKSRFDYDEDTMMLHLRKKSGNK